VGVIEDVVLLRGTQYAASLELSACPKLREPTVADEDNHVLETAVVQLEILPKYNISY